MGGRIKYDIQTKYSILLIYCKSNKNLRFIDMTTTSNIRNYKYILLKNKLANEKYHNTILIKSILDNGGIKNWVIEPIENLDANNYETKERMLVISKKLNINVNNYEDTIVLDIKNEIINYETL